MLLTRYSNSQCSPGVNALRRIQNDVERLFGSNPPDERVWLPALEVVEGKDKLVVAIELPGVKAADVKVTLEDDVLTVSGERRPDPVAGTQLLLSERLHGKFERSVRLAAPVQADQVTATSKDGILTISLPKTEEAKPREIKIATA